MGKLRRFYKCMDIKDDAAETKMVEEKEDMEYTSPRTHEEYTFRHRSACRTPAESRQEYLTSGKEYTEPRKIQ